MILPKGITRQTIFASGTHGENIYMPLNWVIKHGNIPQAIVQTKQDYQSAVSMKDRDHAELLKTKLSVLETLLSMKSK